MTRDRRGNQPPRAAAGRRCCPSRYRGPNPARPDRPPRPVARGRCPASLLPDSHVAADRRAVPVQERVSRTQPCSTVDIAVEDRRSAPRRGAPRGSCRTSPFAPGPPTPAKKKPVHRDHPVDVLDAAVRVAVVVGDRCRGVRGRWNRGTGNVSLTPPPVDSYGKFWNGDAVPCFAPHDLRRSRYR